MDELREQNAHPAKNLHSMSPFFLALLFLSPLIAYAVSILLNEARDPIEIRDLGLGNLKISHDDEYKRGANNAGNWEFNNLARKYSRHRIVLSSFTNLELIAIFVISIPILILFAPLSATISIFVIIYLCFQIKRVSARNSLQKERERVASQLPAIVELFTILISGGESISGSLRQIALRGNGELPGLIAKSVESMERGVGFSEAVDCIGRESRESSVRRFFDSLIVASQRGNSLNDVLMRQVREIRDSQKAMLLKAAGRAEIALMIPIVFLILPISILFALWPSFVTLGQAMSG